MNKHEYKQLRSPAENFPMCATCGQQPSAEIHNIVPDSGGNSETVGAAKRLAREIYDALAVNDDINSWHGDALPMIERITQEHLATNSQLVTRFS